MQSSRPMRMPDNQDYEVDYGTWANYEKSVPVSSTYRVAWLMMAATTGFRTFYPALIPPGKSTSMESFQLGQSNQREACFPR